MIPQSQSENYNLNNITFSSYKNHTTGKIYVWTVPAGFLMHCIDAYPGSVSNSDQKHITLKRLTLFNPGSMLSIIPNQSNLTS